MEESPEAPYDPAAAASASAPTTNAPTSVGGIAGASGGRGRGRGRGRGGGGTAIAGIAELDASLGRAPAAGGGAPPLGAGGGKPLAKKPEGKDFRGPEGLFKKGDWTCTACGNVNWERRQTCNKCQNQKPNAVTTDEVISSAAADLVVYRNTLYLAS